MKDLNQTPLLDRDRDAINAAARMLKEEYPVERVILYGSKARGDSDADSDIDLVLVTSRPIHWRERKAIIDALFNIQMDYDVIISILIVTSTDWSDGIFTAFPIYEEIMRDGAGWSACSMTENDHQNKAYRQVLVNNWVEKASYDLESADMNYRDGKIVQCRARHLFRLLPHCFCTIYEGRKSLQKALPSPCQLSSSSD